jgi:membrane-associated phospholipid phosphatase
MANAFDLWLLTAANHFVAFSPETFYLALKLSDSPSWILAAMALIGMWFSDKGSPDMPALGSRLRLFSHTRVILLFGALMLSFVAARGVAALIYRTRPIADQLLVAPIPTAVWTNIKTGLLLQGSFPSDHAAMFAVIVVGLFAVNHFFGYVGLAAALFFSILRVGIGFHWPTDMLAGAALGAIMAFGTLAIHERVATLLEPYLLWMEEHAALTYPVLFLVILDFTQKFSGLFGLMKSLIGLKFEH